MPWLPPRFTAVDSSLPWTHTDAPTSPSLGRVRTYNDAVSRLPVDRLEPIGRYLEDAELARWQRVCQSRFLWRRIDLDHTTLGGSGNHGRYTQLPRESYPLVEVADVGTSWQRPANMDALTALTKRLACLSRLPALRLVTVQNTVQLPVAMPICHALKAVESNRPLKLILYDVDTVVPARGPWATARMDPLPEDTGGLPACVREAVFFVIPPSPDLPDELQRWVRSPHRPLIQRRCSLSALTLVFDPVTQQSLKAMDRTYNGYRVSSVYYCDSEVPDPSPPGTLDRTQLERNFCYSLALACVSTPDDCSVTIVNLEQAPVSYEKWGAHGSPVRQFSLAKSGKLVSFLQPRSGSSFVQPRYLHMPATGLRHRVNQIKSYVKKWISRLLQDEGRPDELHAMLDRIKYISLAEYLSLEDRVDEWERAPRVREWL